ncbi:MAG TPA: 2-C-methyl-D-erythritol 4-phosphate cytidylyltransferase [Acidimicrobiia bacterium]|nr:2-C-methyl-D-erythritol 4-phosphate cytidylyltransferase [Acidimicrobiia bacterium]
MGHSAAIVVAAGGGERFGGPKQFLRLGTSRLVDHAVAAAAAVCDAVIVVLPAGHPWDGAPVTATVPGGATRAASVRAGLTAVPGSTEVIVVHDAARPLATPELFRAVIAAVDAGADAAIPAVPIADTVKRVDGDRVLDTLPRENLVAVQTPQAFRAETLRAAHRDAGDATDDAALVEGAGGTVRTVAGDPRNRKVTTTSDLVVVAALLDAQP